MEGFVTGFFDIFRGARLICTTGAAWKWMVAPFVALSGILAFLVWGVFEMSEPIQIAVSNWLPEWLGFIASVLRWLVAASIAVAGFFWFSAFAMLISGPFNEFVSEVVENKISGVASENKVGIVKTLLEILRGVGHAVRRFLVYVPTVAIAVAVGFLIPVVGPIAGLLLGGFFAARAAAWDAFDAVLARKGASYEAKSLYLKDLSMRRMGIGAGTVLLMAVPFVNFFAMPIAVAAATQVYVERTKLPGGV